MSDDKKQRRPKKDVRLLCDGPFRERLTALLETQSAVSLARELSEFIGYEVDHSNLSRMKDGKQPSSVFVEPLCRLKGWPMPDVADASPATARVMSILKELESIDRGELARAEEYLVAAVTSARLRKNRVP
jgi:hypothetical protein